MLKLPMSKIMISRQDLIDHENEIKERNKKTEVNSSLDNPLPPHSSSSSSSSSSSVSVTTTTN